MSIPDQSKTHTFNDWKQWEGNWELLQGKAFNMTPAPSSDHQFAVGEIFFILRNWFQNKECFVFTAPFDVFLREDEESEWNVVQPDLSVVCEKEHLAKDGYKGTPSLIVEVLSPSTALKDFNEKYRLYEQSGVPEYWIVDLENKLVHVFRLQEDRYLERKTFGDQDVVTSDVFKGLEVPLRQVFSS